MSGPQCAMDAGCVFFADKTLACPIHRPHGPRDANGSTVVHFTDRFKVSFLSLNFYSSFFLFFPPFPSFVLVLVFVFLGVRDCDDHGIESITSWIGPCSQGLCAHDVYSDIGWNMSLNWHRVGLSQLQN